MNPKTSLLRSTSRVSLATFLSRITGLIRDRLIAIYFPKELSDVFLAMARVPNMLRFLFAEGAFSAAFIPTFIRLTEKQGKEEADKLACSVGRLLVVVTTAVTLVGIALAPWIARLLLIGRVQDEAAIALATDLVRIMFPFLIFIALAGVAMGQLNSVHRFGIPALAPVWFNVSNILYLWLCAGLFASNVTFMKGLAVALVVGGFLQWISQVPSLLRLGMMRHLLGGLWHPETRRILLLMGPMLLGLAGNQIALIINTMYASALWAGSISVLYYANRLFQFPLGVLGIAISTAAFPRLAAQAETNPDEFHREMNHSVRMMFFVILPSTLGLIVLAEPIIYAVFHDGEFARAGLLWPTVWALVAYSVGLIGHAGVKVLSSGFYAFNDTRTPVKITLVSLALNVVLSYVLAFQLVPAALSHVGLAAATSVSAITNVVLLGWFLAKKVGYGWRPGLGKSFTSCLLCSVLMAGVVYGAMRLWPGTLDSKWESILRLLVGLPLGIVAYFGLARWLATDDYRTFIHDLRGKRH